MGTTTGDNKHHHLDFHLHIPHLHFNHHDHDHDHEQMRDVPKGCVAIMVGHEGEKQQKFVIPVIYINHPLFMQLLKEAEEEYGFDQKGPITLPCNVEEFRTVQDIIDQDKSRYHHHHNLHHHSHNQNHHVWCFRT